jgi:hypothetical protein
LTELHSWKLPWSGQQRLFDSCWRVGPIRFSRHLMARPFGICSTRRAPPSYYRSSVNMALFHLKQAPDHIGMMIVRLSVLLLLAATVTPCRSASLDLGSLPEVGSGDYKVWPYINTAAALQKMGREGGCKALLLAAQTNQQSRQIVVLCRMLFVKRATGDFRAARIGAAQFFGGADSADWPLEPIELVHGVPFLIVYGYRLGGRGEAAEDYLRYCMANCDWSTFRFSDVNVSVATASLKKLYASPKWKRPLDNYEREFLAGQIE